jgi:hypothetical protein
MAKQKATTPTDEVLTATAVDDVEDEGVTDEEIRDGFKDLRERIALLEKHVL